MKSWNLRTPDGIIKSEEDDGIIKPEEGGGSEIELEAIGGGRSEEQLGPELSVTIDGPSMLTLCPSSEFETETFSSVSSNFSKGKVSKKLGSWGKATSSISVEWLVGCKKAG